MFFDEPVGEAGIGIGNVFAFICLEYGGDDVAGIEGVIPALSVIVDADLFLRDVKSLFFLLGSVYDGTIAAFLHRCGFFFFFEDRGIPFRFLFEEVVEGSDVVVPIIRHVVSDLGGIKAIFLHDLH